MYCSLNNRYGIGGGSALFEQVFKGFNIDPQPGRWFESNNIARICDDMRISRTRQLWL